VTPAAIRRVERQVGELGVFSAVRLEVLRKSASELLGDQRPTVDALRALAWPPEVELRLIVQESAMSDFQFGAGLSLDSERLSLFTGRPRYLNRNVFGLLDTLDIRLDPAAVLLLTDSKWRFGFDSEVAYTQPSFFEEYTNLTLRTGYQYVIQDALSGHRFRIGPGFARAFFDGRLAAKIGYTFQFDYFPDLACGAECDSAATSGTLDLRGLEIREQYLTATLSAGLAFDLRDSVLEPRSGLYAAFDVAFSHPYLGSDFTYVRMVGDLRLYATPWSFLTLAARLKIGGTLPIDGSQTPLPGRFTAGGANDFRGQSADHLGPALCRVGSVLVPGDAEGGCESLGVDADHFPVGGNLMAVASVEARWYLTSVFGLATFLDIGQVWAERSDYDVTTLQYAPGGGLRLFTPIGAIRADLAYNLTEANTVFHMSLGQAF
jgi:outer membrane translocation and assembly module TamA